MNEELRRQALQMAFNTHETPAEVVARAATYLAFLASVPTTAPLKKMRKRPSMKVREARSARMRQLWADGKMGGGGRRKLVIA